MSSDIDDNPPISHAIADGCEEFAEKVLPTVGGNEHAQVNVAFSFWHHVRAANRRAGCRTWVSRGGGARVEQLGAELDQFVKSHAVVIQ